MRRLAFVAAVVGVLAGCPDPAYEGADRCISCHKGIEQVHASIKPGSCVVCHGGDAKATTKQAAHIAVPSNWSVIRGTALPPAPVGFIRDFAPDQLDALDVAYVRFINPGDIRAVGATCGAAGCHPSEAANMPTSVMSTNAGHYYPSLYLAGQQDDLLARFGSFRATDPACDPRRPGTVCELVTLPPPDESDVRAIVASGDKKRLESLATKHYLAKNCNTCHQAGYPRNDSPGLYRSTGCTACHMVYDKLGVYSGGDPTIPRGQPVHPAKHVLTTKIPAEQCATCHFQGGRIGLLFRGIREGGFSTRPPNAAPINETLYGKAPGFYFTDEDTTNDVDETPPDLHYARGMHCADCHVGSDVHGDGRIYSTSKQQLDLRCEDCHGSVREAVKPDAEGRFRTSKGRVLPQLHQDEGGAVFLTGQVSGRKHVVPQVAKLLGPGGGGSARMHTAMGEKELGFSHADRLTCDTCHTSYNQMCIGCHVSYDLRIDQIDYQTGRSTPGLTRGGRTTYSLHNVLLGTAPDGRIQSVHPSQQLQLTVTGAAKYGGADGELLIGGKISDGKGGSRTVGEFRARGDVSPNNGFAPFFQHTTSKAPRTCNVCHRTADTPEETARVRGVYGYGTGEFMLPGHDGGLVDGLKFLDADGGPTTSWFHAGTGPVDAARRQRALNVTVGNAR